MFSNHLNHIWLLFRKYKHPNEQKRKNRSHSMETKVKMQDNAIIRICMNLFYMNYFVSFMDVPEEVSASNEKSFNIKMHIICYRMKKMLKEKSKILKLIAKQEIQLDTKHFLSAKKERQQASKVLYTFSRQFSKLFSAIFDKINWKNGRILRILQIYWIWASTRIKISFCNS